MHYASEIAHAASLLCQARHAVALTGAGVSTPSGIPDYRSPGVGLWERIDPMKVASIYAFRRNPQAFYNWIRPLAATLLKAEPNPAHYALAALEASGRLKAIVTQNIDGLHQRAGARDVLELHGHLREATCIHCHRILPIQGILDDFLASEDVPHCPECNGVLKPNVVLLGEQLPGAVIDAAMEHARKADLMLVAGSSLGIVPASHLPLMAHKHGGRLILVNLTPTPVDDLADVVIHGDVAEVLPCIAQACTESTS